jgi:hypothetical protein
MLTVQNTSLSSNQTNSTQSQLNEVDKDFQLIRFVVTVSAVVIIFVLLSNLMLIYGLVMTARPLSIVTKSFIYLSCVDILTALISMTQSNILMYTSILSTTTTWVLVALSTCLHTYGLFIFCTICVFRYLALRKPLLQLAPRYCHRVLLVGLLCKPIYGVAVYFGNTSMDADILVLSQTVAAIMFLVLIIFVLILNVMSYWIIQIANRMSNDLNSNSSDRQKEAVQTLIIMTIFYVVFNLPMPIFFLLAFAKQFDLPFYLRLEISTLMHALVMLNVGINAIVYIVRTKKIRTFFFRKLRSVCN